MHRFVIVSIFGFEAPGGLSACRLPSKASNSSGADMATVVYPTNLVYVLRRAAAYSDVRWSMQSEESAASQMFYELMPSTVVRQCDSAPDGNKGFQ